MLLKLNYFKITILLLRLFVIYTNSIIIAQAAHELCSRRSEFTVLKIEYET